MPLPSRLTFNELNGEEGKAVLTKRFADLLNTVPYLQRHITLPRVKMSLEVHLDLYADQQYSERHDISDELTIDTELAVATPPPLFKSFDLRSVVDASPTGKPPDQVRDEHGIPIARPVRGPIATEDRTFLEPVETAPGFVIDRTQREQRGTFVKIDQGRAGLDDPTARDPRRDGGIEIKNVGGRDGKPVTSPKADFSQFARDAARDKGGK